MNEIIKKDVERIKQNLIEFEDKIKGKTFLVTGGAGFLGSWFCDVLNEFKARIICVDNLSTGSLENIKHLLKNENFKFIQHDVTKPLKIEENIDYIIHMASIASPPLYQKYPIQTLDANIIGTINILELAREKNVKAFLFTSTSEVYGDVPEHAIPTSENFAGYVYSYGPRAMYDEGKRAAEAYLYSYFKQSGFPVRIARVFNTFGPRLDFSSPSYGRALARFVTQALNNQPLTVYNDGKQTRSFCYVTDQIEGLFRFLLTDGLDGEVINIGNDVETTIFDLASKIIEITNSKSQPIINSVPEYEIEHDPRRRCPDIAKAKKLLKFQPKVSLEDGLRRTIEFFRQSDRK
jgi:UDP-glucuronate decarboxylase